MKKITQIILIVFTTISLQAQNKLLSSISESYFSGTWNNSGATNHEYDISNNHISETRYYSNDGVYVISSRNTFTYNANNKVTQAIYEQINFANSQLENESKTNYTYTNGKLTTIESQEWISATWVNNNKTVISYNANNLPDTALFYDWQASQWVNEGRSIVEYNLSNKISAQINQDLNGVQWVNTNKTIYDYNANNKIIAEIRANWDAFNNLWTEVGASRTDYTYDVAGNRTSATQTGNYNYKEEFLYDFSSLMSNFANPFTDKTGIDAVFGEFPYINKLLSELGYSFDLNTNSFQVSSRTTHNYNSAIVLATEKLTKGAAAIAIYPNPATTKLNIKLSDNLEITKIIITDLSGKKIFEQNGNLNTINIENLAKGLYVIEVLIGESRLVEKFMKE